MAKANEGGAAVAEPKAETALSVFKKNYGELAESGGGIAEVISQNLGGEAITAADLVRVKWPGAGSLSFGVPSLDGAESRKSLSGIIVHIANARTYWASRNVSNNPPDCSSSDLSNGTPREEWKDRPAGFSGKCDECPLAAFGTAKDGDGKPGAGQACKQKKIVFLLEPGNLLPTVVQIPPSSLKRFKEFITGMTGRNIVFYKAMVEFKLKEAVSKGGTKYAELVPTMQYRLEAEEAAKLQSYVDTMRSVLSRVSDDVGRSDDDA